jgi:flagellar FliJ protein
MAFKFRYKAILSYREHVKEKAEVELARAQYQLHRATDLLNQYGDHLTEGRKALETFLRKSISSDDLKVHLDYLSGLKIRIEIQAKEVQKCKEKAREKLKDLLEKTKEYKVIEKVKQKDFEKWNYQQLQEERKRMNEVAVLRHKQDLF